MEQKVCPLSGGVAFIDSGGNRCGLTARTISAAVSVQEGNRAPRSRVQLHSPSVATKDPVTSLIVLSWSRIHSSNFSVRLGARVCELSHQLAAVCSGMSRGGADF